MFADDAGDQGSRVKCSVVVGIYPTLGALKRRSLAEPKKLIFCAAQRRAFFNGLKNQAGFMPSSVLAAIVAANGRFVSHDDIELMWSDDPEGGPLDIRRSVHVLILKVVAAAESIGLRIENVYGWGWRLADMPAEPITLQAAE